MGAAQIRSAAQLDVLNSEKVSVEGITVGSCRLIGIKLACRGSSYRPDDDLVVLHGRLGISPTCPNVDPALGASVSKLRVRQAQGFLPVQAQDNRLNLDK